MWRGVARRLPCFASTRAPRSRRQPTACGLCARAARCSGAAPALSTCSMSEPASRNSSITDFCRDAVPRSLNLRPRIARVSGAWVAPRRFSAFKSAQVAAHQSLHGERSQRVLREVAYAVSAVYKRMRDFLYVISSATRACAIAGRARTSRTSLASSRDDEQARSSTRVVNLLDVVTEATTECNLGSGRPDSAPSSHPANGRLFRSEKMTRTWWKFLRVSASVATSSRLGSEDRLSSVGAAPSR